VNGRVLLEDRKLKTVDGEALLAQAGEQTRQLIVQGLGDLTARRGIRPRC
jgi:hypothetical protein